MIREKKAQFESANRPWIYTSLYYPFAGLFHVLGGIHIEGIDKIPGKGKKLVTANHETMADPFVMGVVNEEALASLAKAELGTWKYLWAGKWALVPLMNTTLINRTGADYEILDEAADFIRNKDAAVLSYLYGTRKAEKKGAKPKTGVAHIAIKSSQEGKPTPVVPFGHSMSVWRPGRPIQVVVGDAIYAPENSQGLEKAALVRARKELTGQLAASIVSLTARALELDEERAGRRFRIVRHDSEPKALAA